MLKPSFNLLMSIWPSIIDNENDAKPTAITEPKTKTRTLYTAPENTP